jgi:hypothetical protein
MGWLIVGEASLEENPKDRVVFVCMADRNFQMIDEPSTILPVPEFAKSVQLTVEQVFSWIKKKV